ncbi:inverse autotransporter beta domain-containing protein, partial [Citrobacter braakii]|uniref:inverse autotransporter beta domain-containing protein n=1 Tax=Citrobacter braakii TaxID=57706 RepID=UPI0024E04D36
MSSEDRNRSASNLAMGQLSGMATRMADNAIRDWLDQKGNARIQLSSERSNADFLVPVWESANTLVFNQAGVRRGSERTTWNGGVGLRYWTDSAWMFGGNAFYDYDQTGRNARYSLGFEARTDYLNLSVNRYFRLTDWQQSPLQGMRDYDERPANGYDVRAKYWLPALPQVGGELVYEKYFGQGIDVGSGTVSSDSLKSSPKVLTTAISYTPFPLFTLRVGKRTGDNSDVFASADFSYRFGLPFNEQLSTDNVSILRSMKGGRYDLVDRRYDIVMQYRKQELVSLTLPPSVSGQALSAINVAAIAKSKYGISRVEWRAPELVASGGQVITTTTPTDVKLILPAWHTPESGKSNTYTLSAVMTDIEGNKTAPAETTITVLASSAAIPRIHISSSSALANGLDAITVEVEIKDVDGKVVPGEKITLSMAGSGNNNTKLQANSSKTMQRVARPKTMQAVSAFPRPVTGCVVNATNNCPEFSIIADEQGHASAFYTHTAAGKYRLTATLDNGNLAVADITFEEYNASAYVSELALTATPSQTIAGRDVNLSLNAIDSKGNPVFGLSSSDISLVSNVVGQKFSRLNWTEDSNIVGGYNARTKMSIAGEHVLTVDVGNKRATANVTVIGDITTATLSGMSTVSDNAVANGTATNSVKAVVQDANGNPLSGMTVRFSADHGASIAATGITGADGSVTVTLTSTTAGLSTVTATVNSSNQSVDTHFIADTASAIL